MDELSHNIKRLRKQSNLTQSELGELLNVATTTISAWESGRNKPLVDNIEQLSSVFSVRKAELLGETTQLEETLSEITQYILELTKERQERVVKFIMKNLEEQNREVNELTLDTPDFIDETLYGILSAGTGQCIEYDTRKLVTIPTVLLPDTEYNLILKVVGNAMLPTFKNGEYIFIKKTTDINNGQFGVFQVNDEIYVKKVYIEENTLRLVSLNSDCKDLFFDENDKIQLIGTVVM